MKFSLLQFSEGGELLSEEWERSISHRSVPDWAVHVGPDISRFWDWFCDSGSEGITSCLHGSCNSALLDWALLPPGSALSFTAATSRACFGASFTLGCSLLQAEVTAWLDLVWVLPGCGVATGVDCLWKGLWLGGLLVCYLFFFGRKRMSVVTISYLRIWDPGYT